MGDRDLIKHMCSSLELLMDPLDAKAQVCPLIFTHQRFTIAYNPDRTIYVNLTTDTRMAIVPAAKVTFIYFGAVDTQ